MCEDNDNTLAVFIDTQFDDVNAPGSCTDFFTLLSTHSDEFTFHDMMQAFFSVVSMNFGFYIKGFSLRCGFCVNGCLSPSFITVPAF